MRFGVALLVLAVPAVGSAQTEIRRVGDLVEVRATTAALADVLDRLGRETGMKVVYDGAPPRARVSLALPPSAPAQAVLAVLEGQGLNYLARMDPTGLKVDTLYVVSAGGAAAASGVTPARTAGARPPGVPTPDEDDEPEPEPEPEPTAVIQRPERPDRSDRAERIERIERERVERERAAAEAADDEKPAAPRPGVYTPGTVQPLLFPPGGQNGQGQNGQGGPVPGQPGPLRMPPRPNPQASPSLQ
jgi:hypothetical protein